MLSRREWFGFAVACSVVARATGAVQAGETITATAVIGAGQDAPSIAVTFVIDRYMTPDERAAVVAALKQGTPALHEWLAALPDCGSIIVRDKRVPLKYVYRRPGHAGRIVLMTNEPLAFLDPGSDATKSKSGYEFALVMLDFSLPGFGSGEINPAARIGISESGQIITQEYGAAVVRLSDVRKR
jgi:hypothetical protein